MIIINLQENVFVLETKSDILPFLLLKTCQTLPQVITISRWKDLQSTNGLMSQQ